MSPPSPTPPPPPPPHRPRYVQPIPAYMRRISIGMPNFGKPKLCVCLLLQDLLQSCARWGRRIVEDMCYEIRRAEACVDKADHHTLVNAGETRFSQLLYSKVNGCTARGGWQHWLRRSADLWQVPMTCTARRSTPRPITRSPRALELPRPLMHVLFRETASESESACVCV